MLDAAAVSHTNILTFKLSFFSWLSACSSGSHKQEEETEERNDDKLQTSCLCVCSTVSANTEFVEFH